MVDAMHDTNKGEKSFTQKAVEGWGLDYPDDVEKFLEVLDREGFEQWTVTQLFDAMVEAFPEKKKTILSIPVHRTVDGEVHIQLLSKDD